MISEFMGKHHATIIHSVNKHCEMNGLIHPKTGNYIVKRGNDFIQKPLKNGEV